MRFSVATIGLCAATAMVVGALSEARADTVVGNFTNANCYPFSCFAGDPDGAGINFQEVYSASAFSGLTSVGSISFFRDPSYSGLMDSATYSISFYITQQAVDALSTTGFSKRMAWAQCCRATIRTMA
jgi:hypothetical protein